MTVYFLDPGKEMPTGHGSLKTPGGQVRASGRAGRGPGQTYVYVRGVDVVRTGHSVHRAQNHPGMIVCGKTRTDLR